MIFMLISSMEEHQLRLIRQNFYSLIQNTKCTEEFLLKFKGKKILTKMDIIEINKIRNEDSHETDKAYQFYNRVLKCPNGNAYELVVNALKETGQSVAHEILSKGNFKRETRFRAPPTCILELLSSRTDKVILLQSWNAQITLNRLVDSLRDKMVLVNLEENNLKLGADILGVVVLEEEKMKLIEIVKKLSRTTGMFVVLCGKHKFTSNLESVAMITKETLTWEDLTLPFQEQILQKIKLITGGLDLTSPLDFVEGENLIRIIKEVDDNGRQDQYLLGNIIEDFAYRKGATGDDLINDLGSIAVRQYYFQEIGTTNKEPYKDDKGLKVLVKKKVLKILSSVGDGLEYEFMNEYVGHYFLGQYLCCTTLSVGNSKSSKFKKFAIQKILQTTNVEPIILCKCPNDPAQLMAFEFKHRLAAYFVDFHLDPLNQIQVGWLEDVDKIMRASINGNYTNILRKLCFTDGVREISDELAILTVLKGNLTTIYVVLQAYRQKRFDILMPKLIGTQQWGTLLHAAVRRGDYEVWKVILEEYGFINEVKSERPHMKNLIHTCVENTLHQDLQAINDRKRIIKMLLKLNGNLINEQLEPDSKNPLHCSKIHFELIKFLIAEGTEFGLTSKGETLLHTAAADGRTPEEYHEIVQFLVSSGYRYIFDWSLRTSTKPLHKLIYHMEVKEETLKLFGDLGVLLNDKDNDGDNVLDYAVYGGRSKHCLCMLVGLGAEWSGVNSDGDTILHKAAYYGNAETLEYFINLGVNVNARNNAGQTPLLCLFIGSDSAVRNIHECVELLIKSNADVKLVDEKHRNALWYSLNGALKDEIKPETVQLLK